MLRCLPLALALSCACASLGTCVLALPVCVCVCVCTEGHTRQQGLKGLEMNALLDDRFHCSFSLGFQVFAAVLIQVHLLCVCVVCMCVCARANAGRHAHGRHKDLDTHTHHPPHTPTHCTHREQPPDDIMHRQSLGVIRTVTPNLSQRPRTRRLDVVFGLSHLSRQMDSECRRVCRWVRGHFCMHTCILQAFTVLLARARARAHTHTRTHTHTESLHARMHAGIGRFLPGHP